MWLSRSEGQKPQVASSSWRATGTGGGAEGRGRRLGFGLSDCERPTRRTPTATVTRTNQALPDPEDVRPGRGRPTTTVRSQAAAPPRLVDHRRDHQRPEDRSLAVTVVDPSAWARTHPPGTPPTLILPTSSARMPSVGRKIRSLGTTCNRPGAVRQYGERVRHDSHTHTQGRDTA